MKKIIKARQSGKTTELIKISAKSGDYIVCSSPKECQRIQLVAQGMNLNIPFPITYEDLIEKQYYGKNISGFLIDNIEMFLNYISLGVPVNALTMTDENVLR